MTRSRTPVRRRAPGAALRLGGALVLCGTASPVTAQQGETGGVRLVFDISERLEATENRALDPVSAGTTWRSDTRLGFSLNSETRRNVLSARVAGALRVVDAPGTVDDESFGFSEPDLALSYLRRGATARFEFDAILSSQEIAFLDTSDLIAEDGSVILPEELDDLTGTGTRRRARVSTSLRMGEGGPFGYGLRAAYTLVDYSDTTSTTLFDTERLDLGADVRLDLAPDRRLTLGMGYSLFDTDDPTSGRRETVSFDTGIAVDRALGTLSLGFDVDHVEEGTRYALSAGLSRELPLGAIDLTLGVARGTSGGTAVVGSAAISRRMPLGTLGAQLRRSYSSGSDDTERLVTAISANWGQQLTPLAGLSLDLAYIETKDSVTDQSVTSATLGATFSYTLTPDWSLDLGYRRRFRDDDAAGTGWAASDSVFLGVGRSFRGTY